MKLIYKCLHCNAMAAVPTTYVGTKVEAVEIAYARRDIGGAPWGLRQYGPHDCDEKSFGVAQLVAVIDD